MHYESALIIQWLECNVNILHFRNIDDWPFQVFKTAGTAWQMKTWLHGKYRTIYECIYLTLDIFSALLRGRIINILWRYRLIVFFFFPHNIRTRYGSRNEIHHKRIPLNQYISHLLLLISKKCQMFLHIVNLGETSFLKAILINARAN